MVCLVLHGIAWYQASCTISHYLALSCTVLHYLAVRYTYSQQMSPVIALDIAVMAQKVQVQYRGPVWSEKKGGWLISSRSGWLLELLTELTSVQKVAQLIVGRKMICDRLWIFLLPQLSEILWLSCGQHLPHIWRANPPAWNLTSHPNQSSFCSQNSESTFVIVQFSQYSFIMFNYFLCSK